MNITNQSLDPDKPTYYIDASLLKRSSCRRRINWMGPRGLSRTNWSTNYKAGYGSAFHKAMQNYYSNRSTDDAIVHALNLYAKYESYIDISDYRTAGHLELTIREYFKTHERGDSITPLVNPVTGKPLLEIKFCIPYIVTDVFQIALTGTIDMIADYFGRIAIIDHKVTGWSQYPDRFIEPYSWDIQMMFYSWIYKQLSGQEDYLPVVINGVFISKPTTKAVKTGKFDGVEFRRSGFIEFNSAQMIQFETWLRSKLFDIQSDIEAYNYGKIPPPADMASCHEPFGMCQFFNTCRLSPELQEQSLATFDQSTYNPLEFQD